MSNAEESQSEGDKLRSLGEEMLNAHLKRNPPLATQLGVHKYDHLLPEGSLAAKKEEIELLSRWKGALEEIEPEKLGEEDRLSRKLGLHFLRLSLYQETVLEQWRKNPTAPQTIGNALFPLLKRDFAPLEKRLESFRARLEKVPSFLEKSKELLSQPVELWLDVARESGQRLPALFQVGLKMADDCDWEKDERQKLEEAAEKARAALADYSNWLAENRPGAEEEFAIGSGKFKELLEARELGYEGREILELGKEYLRESREEMERWTGEIEAGLSVKDAVKRVKSNRPESFQKALSWYRKGLEDAKGFIGGKNLATVPEGERIEVTETPQYMRHLIPFAAYVPPAKFERGTGGTYLVTPPGEGEDLSNFSYWEVRNTTVHEGYPGHHLQLSAALEHEDIFRLFTTLTAVETIEGWAHYCEEMMKKYGFDDTPEARLLQAQDIRWRAARIVVDVKLSRGQMSYEEGVQFMADTVDMEREAAQAEVKRYTQNPAYQLSYLLGKKMIKDLREEIKEKMGGDFNDHFFHDTILYGGSLPFKYLREEFELKLKERSSACEQI